MSPARHVAGRDHAHRDLIGGLVGGLTSALAPSTSTSPAAPASSSTPAGSSSNPPATSHSATSAAPAATTSSSKNNDNGGLGGLLGGIVGGVTSAIGDVTSIAGGVTSAVGDVTSDVGKLVSPSTITNAPTTTATSTQNSGGLVGELLGGVGGVVSKVVGGVVTVLDDGVDDVLSVVDQGLGDVGSIVGEVVPPLSTVVNVVVNDVTSLVGVVVGDVTSLVGGVTSVVGVVVDDVTSVVGDVTSVVGDVTSVVGVVVGDVTSIVGGVTSIVGGVTSEVGGITSIVGGVTSNLGGVTSAVGGLTSAIIPSTTGTGPAITVSTSISGLSLPTSIIGSPTSTANTNDPTTSAQASPSNSNSNDNPTTSAQPPIPTTSQSLVVTIVSTSGGTPTTITSSVPVTFTATPSGTTTPAVSGSIPLNIVSQSGESIIATTKGGAVSSLLVSGTFSSWIGSPTAAGGGGGSSPHTSLFGGLGTGGFVAIILLILLFLMLGLIVGMRRYRARRRANRLNGWLSGWRHGSADMLEDGAAGAAAAGVTPQMSERGAAGRRLSDDSFGTPEHSLFRSASASPYPHPADRAGGAPGHPYFAHLFADGASGGEFPRTSTAYTPSMSSGSPDIFFEAGNRPSSSVGHGSVLSGSRAVPGRASTAGGTTLRSFGVDITVPALPELPEIFKNGRIALGLGAGFGKDDGAGAPAPAAAAAPLSTAGLNAADLFDDDDDEEDDAVKAKRASARASAAYGGMALGQGTDVLIDASSSTSPITAANAPGLTTMPLSLKSKRSSATATRASQLTIRPVPFNSHGALALPSDQRESVQTVGTTTTGEITGAYMQDPFADPAVRAARGSMQSVASEWTSRSLDLQSFPTPPKRASGGAAALSAFTKNLFGAASRSRSSLQNQIHPAPESQLAAPENNANAGPVSPARSDFNYALNSFSETSHPLRHSHLSGLGADSLDPFADNHPGLPSPIASSAARSLFFPGGSSEGNNSPTASASNITRIARSWRPTKDSYDEMEVSAGDIVRVISRHASIPPQSRSDPNLPADLNSAFGLGDYSNDDVQGGWALVKKLDPETGISKRGFVPVNCLMDVQGPNPGPSSVPMGQAA
ncbi:hypothetical protein DL93DRAFT_2225533 [Clavulina sp. PMI_390]|nr:hypothetical protein DL93DRAFT_2225533 [Clavulina sp. PMI_390]